jgi:peptidyl-prolyl cis-trans isomerase SurA
MAERQAAIDQLRKWRADILAGRADFAELAKKYSQDGSAAIGGDLGWASAGYFVPEFEAAVDALRDGAIAEPLVTRFGVHLVQVLERRQSLMDEVALQEWAKKQMRAEQGAEWIAAWVREVRAAAYVRRMDAR